MSHLPQDTARALANSLGALETSEADARELSPAEVASLAAEASESITVLGSDGMHHLTKTGHELMTQALFDSATILPDQPRSPLTESDLDAAQARAIEALLAIPGWKRDEDWFDRGETHEDDREAICIDTVREIVAAGLEGYRS